MTTATKPAPSHREAPASVLPDSPEKQEVTVKPDIPIASPSPTPAGPAEIFDLEATAADPARALYDSMVAAMCPDEPIYVAGRRGPRLKVGDHLLSPGDVVPGAHGWLRRETYERLGRIERR